MSFTKNIEKIFKSFDFRGNRIINAKTDTPTDQSHPEILANKIYVDNSLTYQTEKATQLQNPFYFNWITGVNGKTFKQILDDLFFPRILPIYKNIELQNISNFSFTNLKVSNVNLQHKYNAYYNQAIIGMFNYTLNSDADRSIANFPYIKFIDENNVETIFNATTNDLVYQINFNYTLISSNTTLKFGITESSTSNTKQDSYGDDYVPQEFQSELNYEIDITELFLQNIILYDSFLISDIRTTEAIPDYTELTIPTLFTKKNYVEFDAEVFGIYDILIPLSIVQEISNDISNKTLLYIVTDYSDSINPVTISIEELLFSWLKKYTLGTTIDYNGITYVKYQFNFGTWDFPVRIELTF